MNEFRFGLDIVDLAVDVLRLADREDIANPPSKEWLRRVLDCARKQARKLPKECRLHGLRKMLFNRAMVERYYLTGSTTPPPPPAPAPEVKQS